MEKIDEKDFLSLGRNDQGKVGGIYGKSFCIINDRARGDIMASLSLGRQLKIRGASMVSLGIHYRTDLSLFRCNPDIDFIFTMPHSWPTLSRPRWAYDCADYVINQCYYTHQSGLSFYESRVKDACIPLSSVADFRPSIRLADHVEPFVDKLISEWGIAGKPFFTLHPQGFHPSRQLTESTLNRVIELIKEPLIVLGYDLEFEAPANVINFTNRNGMDISAELLRRCAGFIGVCSVWSHVAFAYNKPCFIFYSDTRPEQMFAKHHQALEYIKTPPGIQSGIEVKNLDQLLEWIRNLVE